MLGRCLETLGYSDERSPAVFPMLPDNRTHARAREREWWCVQTLVVLAAVLACTTTAGAQEPQQPPPTNVHEHVAVTAPLLTPTKEASGTAWLPQITPMYGVHRPWRGWDLRLAGVVFVRTLYEPGNRHRTGGSSTRQAGSVRLGHGHGPPQRRWRALRRSGDAQCRTMDRSRLRFFEFSCDGRGVPR